MSSNPPPTVAAPSVMDGLLARNQLAAEVGMSERTVIRWERAGMPCIRVGMLRLYDPVKVREWLLSHEYRDVPKRAQCNSKEAA